MAFTLAVLLSAGLLFVIEPMFGKMVLPFLGGSPAVWTTCMLFFQAALLLGYLYAHLGPRWLGTRRHMGVHVGLLALGLLLLPIGVAHPGATLREGHPVLWLLSVLALSIGIPFTLLSSTGPLLQVWYSQTAHSDADNPYFLYAASNAGSLLGLLSYPFLIEPAVPLAGQAKYWGAGYLILIGLVIVSASSRRRLVPAQAGLAQPQDPAPSINRAAAFRWVALAFVPSSFLLALTTHITMDVAAVPLLWIVPLVLYLLSFTMVFSRRPILSHDIVVRWQPVGLICLAVLDSWGPSVSSAWLLPLYLLVFFLTALVCHGELARSRPPAESLTNFYLCIAIGGVMGGIFNAVIAPGLFNTVLEYPLTLVAACAVRPALASPAYSRPMRRDLALIGFATLVLLVTRIGLGDRPVPAVAVLASGLAAIVCLRMSRDPTRLALAVGGVVLAGMAAASARRGILLTERNFFGVHEVRVDEPRHMRVLMNGTTKHGGQSLDPHNRMEPISYYSRQGPLGDIFGALPGRGGRRVAVIGLGAGGMAAYAARGERWTFYEIDPDVVRIARDTTLFTYLRDTPASTTTILGDGRLSMAKAPRQQFDLTIIDAFSSDAIPVHLLTAEALAVYLQKLSVDGAIVFHLSNRYLDLEPVLARLFQSAGLFGLIRDNTARTPELVKSNGDPSIWAIAAPHASSLAALQNDARWRPLRGRSTVALWTDDFSNIFSVFRWVPGGKAAHPKRAIP